MLWSNSLPTTVRLLALIRRMQLILWSSLPCHPSCGCRHYCLIWKRLLTLMLQILFRLPLVPCPCVLFLQDCSSLLFLLRGSSQQPVCFCIGGPGKSKGWSWVSSWVEVCRRCHIFSCIWGPDWHQFCLWVSSCIWVSELEVPADVSSVPCPQLAIQLTPYYSSQ